MNLFQSMAMTALISGLVAGTALADNTTSSTTTSTTTGTDSTTNTTSSPDTIHIGETYQEHLENEMAKNAAQARQGQQPKQDPQRMGKPVQIDGVNQ